MNQITANSAFSVDWTLEDALCPMCGGEDADGTPFQQNPFKVQHCKTCGLWYLSPRLATEEADKFYESDEYFAGGDGVSGYDDYAVQEQSLRATFRKLCS